ncbi:MAG TPA: hypothetical protein DDW76_10845 [Cyanobacteria bacterium UBA11369]|nr:hypothetical protein [Cyanobacteria bacterium UBA11371]HBE34395.1 hypothetical protein [Cyanobacteria bacterium UBA11368]HBE49268.1 hypothetical protein [Cyanobacteria bacterium UBA11369]
MNLIVWNLQQLLSEAEPRIFVPRLEPGNEIWEVIPPLVQELKRGRASYFRSQAPAWERDPGGYTSLGARAKIWDFGFCNRPQMTGLEWL